VAVDTLVVVFDIVAEATDEVTDVEVMVAVVMEDVVVEVATVDTEVEVEG